MSQLREPRRYTNVRKWLSLPVVRKGSADFRGPLFGKPNVPNLVRTRRPSRRDRKLNSTLRRVLATLPTTLDRLIYLAALRNEGTGKYHHPKLVRYSDESVDECLARLHEITFQKWLTKNLPQQAAEIEELLARQIRQQGAAGEWFKLDSYLQLIPPLTGTAARELFISDIKILLAILAPMYAQIPLNWFGE